QLVDRRRVVVAGVAFGLAKLDAGGSVQADLSGGLVSHAHVDLLESFIGAGGVDPVMATHAADSDDQLRAVVVIEIEIAAQRARANQVVPVIPKVVIKPAAEGGLSA